MALNSVLGRIVIFSLIGVSGIVGGISGAVLTEMPLQAVFIAFLVGFSSYTALLYITLTVMYLVGKRIEEVTANDK